MASPISTFWSFTDRGPQRVADMAAESKRVSNGKSVFSHRFTDIAMLEEHDFLTMPWVNGMGESLRIADWLVQQPKGS